MAECLLGQVMIVEPGAAAQCALEVLAAHELVGFEDTHRAGLMQGPEETLGRGGALRGGEADEHPAGGPIDGDEPVLALGLVGQLREVFHIVLRRQLEPGQYLSIRCSKRPLDAGIKVLR